MSKSTIPTMLDFEPLCQVWQRLAESRGGQFLKERYEPDFWVDYNGLPFVGEFISPQFERMYEAVKQLDIFRPRLIVRRETWEITLTTIGRALSPQNTFHVSAVAKFLPSSNPFYLRTRSKTRLLPISQEFRKSDFAQKAKAWSMSNIKYVPPFISLSVENFPNSHEMRSGSFDLDERYFFETTDSNIMRSLLINWRIREPLLGEHVSVVIKSDCKESGCVFVDRKVDATTVEDSNLLLCLTESILESLSNLGVIAQ